MECLFGLAVLGIVAWWYMWFVSNIPSATACKSQSHTWSARTASLTPRRCAWHTGKISRLVTSVPPHRYCQRRCRTTTVEMAAPQTFVSYSPFNKSPRLLRPKKQFWRNWSVFYVMRENTGCAVRKPNTTGGVAGDCTHPSVFEKAARVCRFFSYQRVRARLPSASGATAAAAHAHLKSIMPENPDPDAPVLLGGGTRPNNRFRTLCDLARIEPKISIETGEEQH